MAKGLLGMQKLQRKPDYTRKPPHLSLCFANGASPSSVGEIRKRDSQQRVLAQRQSLPSSTTSEERDQLINDKKTEVVKIFSNYR